MSRFQSKIYFIEQQAFFFGVRVLIGGLAFICLMMTSAWPVLASDLGYTLMSPNFGGSNGIALSMAQQQNSLKSARVAARVAAATAAAAANTASGTNSVNQSFINAIVSQLTGLVAYKIANGIANTAPGQSGSIQSGGTTITYVNSDGQLNVTLTSPTGSTTIAVPTGG